MWLLRQGERELDEGGQKIQAAVIKQVCRRDVIHVIKIINPAVCYILKLSGE